MATIHPMAIVDPSAILADDATVGPFCVVESDVTIGAGTVLREHVVVRKHTTLGEGNMVDPFVCLGGEPQDLKFITVLHLGREETVLWPWGQLPLDVVTPSLVRVTLLPAT